MTSSHENRLHIWNELGQLAATNIQIVCIDIMKNRCDVRATDQNGQFIWMPCIFRGKWPKFCLRCWFFCRLFGAGYLSAWQYSFFKARMCTDCHNMPNENRFVSGFAKTYKPNARMPEWAMQCDIYVICSFVLRSGSEFEPNWAPCTIHNDTEIVAVCTACDECWSHSCFAFARIHASQLIRLPETATAPRQRDPSSFHTNLCLRCAAMCRWMELGGKEAVYKYLSHRNAQKCTETHNETHFGANKFCISSAGGFLVPVATSRNMTSTISIDTWNWQTARTPGLAHHTKW